MVLELRDDHYHTVGSKANARQSDRTDAIEDILVASEGPLTAEEVRKHWPEHTAVTRPGLRTIQVDLNRGYDLDVWERTGEGTRGKPYRFISRMLQPLVAGNQN